MGRIKCTRCRGLAFMCVFPPRSRLHCLLKVEFFPSSSCLFALYAPGTYHCRLPFSFLEMIVATIMICDRGRKQDEEKCTYADDGSVGMDLTSNGKMALAKVLERRVSNGSTPSLDLNTIFRIEN